MSACLYVKDSHAPGYYSPDKVSIDFCEEDSFLEVEGLDPQSSGPNRDPNWRRDELIPGITTMTCKKCPSPFGASECSLSSQENDIVAYYDYATYGNIYGESNVDKASWYRLCAIQCGLFSLHASEGVVLGLSAVLVVLFFFGFLFLDREMKSKDNTDEDAESDAEKEEEQDKEQEQTGYNWIQAGSFFLFVAIPVADTITDIAYIISSKFYNVGFFAAALLAFLLPNMAFCHLLYTRNRLLLRPKLYLPGISIIPESMVVAVHDNLGKILYSCCIYFPWAVLNLPHLFLKIVLGMLMYSTKIFAIGGVYNRWCWLWTGAEEDSIAMSLDTVILNESIFMEIVAETLPQVIIQITNNYYINPDIAQWGEINLASLAITIVNTLNGLWKVVY
jgi:uncharacterized membrane protein